MIHSPRANDTKLEKILLPILVLAFTFSMIGFLYCETQIEPPYTKDCPSDCIAELCYYTDEGGNTEKSPCLCAHANQTTTCSQFLRDENNRTYRLGQTLRLVFLIFCAVCVFSALMCSFVSCLKLNREKQRLASMASAAATYGQLNTSDSAVLGNTVVLAASSDELEMGSVDSTDRHVSEATSTAV